MAAPPRLTPTERAIRVLRLMAAGSVVIALVALISIAKGGLGPDGQKLIIVAVALGACALVGMATVAFPFAYRQKDKNDPRS